MAPASLSSKLRDVETGLAWAGLAWAGIAWTDWSGLDRPVRLLVEPTTNPPVPVAPRKPGHPHDWPVVALKCLAGTYISILQDIGEYKGPGLALPYLTESM